MAAEEKHLGIEQFEQLLEARTRTPHSGDVQFESVKQANHHLLNCDRCRTVLSRLEAWDGLPRQEAEVRLAAATADCPPDTAVLELAAGIHSENGAEALLEHIAVCGHCGPLLRQAGEWFADEPLLDEDDAIAKLATATAGRQTAIASQISSQWPTHTPQRGSASASEKQSPRPWFLVPRFAGAFTAVLFLIAAGVFLWRTTRPDANRLLAEAYTERRTLELRFAGAAYAPVHRERGASGSFFDRPQALLDADALIARRLKNNPRDFDARQNKARADLLEWNYEQAISVLRQLQQENADSLAVKQDLAIAYFERAEDGQPSGYGTAAELLGQILKQEPANLLARYNRALVYERLLLYHEAQSDWQAYLRLDGKSSWADEARQHAAEIQRKLGTSEKQRDQPLLSFKEISSASLQNYTIESTLDANVEDYLNVATRHWLPLAVSSGNSSEARDAQSAILRLGRVLAEKHGDDWLSDVLGKGSARPPSDGLADLSEAVALVERGEYGAAGKAAARAERRFQNSGNSALAARSGLERLVALDRSFEGKECRTLGAVSRRQVADSSYRWIQTELLLESAVCSAASGDLEAAYDGSRRARELAASARFSHLYLRAQGFVAEYDTDQNRAFASNIDGLRAFWQQDSNAFRGHQFFEALAMLAEGRSNWQLATAFNREAVLAVAGTPRTSVEATARLYLGRAEYQAGFRREAASEWQAAVQLLASLPTDDAIIAILTELHVNLAKSALDDGRLSDATNELGAAAPRFLHPGLHEVSIQYFSTLARLHALEGHTKEADKAWHDAISRTETEIRSARSPFDRIRLAGLCKECFERLARLQIARSDPRAAWKSLEAYRATGLGNAVPRSFDETKFLEQRLPQGTALLSAVELEDGVAVWLVSRKEITFKRLPIPLAQLHSTAKRFAAECSDRNSSLTTLRSDGAQLYRWLILPFEEKLVDARLLIVERGEPTLSQIPVEALVEASGAYLSERISVAYTLGVAYLDPASLSPQNLFLASALLVAGPSASGPTLAALPPLPEATSEVHELASLFLRSTVLEGPRAKSSVLRREIPLAAVFHFAGHAIPTQGRTELLVAAAEGKENVAFWPEATNDLANLRLVFLSACATAKSGEDDSLDLAGLAESYRLLGSKTVVGNKWIVDSAASRYFALAFYEALARGTSIPDAAEQAQTKVRKLARYGHPFFWSAPSLLV